MGIVGLMEEQRPIECSSCKKKTTITYREMQERKIKTSKHCVDCPLLKDKIISSGKEEAHTSDIEKNVICPSCKTNLYQVMTGSSFGCKQCYEIFEDFLTHELAKAGALPQMTNSKLQTQPRTPFHLGNIPSRIKSPELSDKLRSLNSALREALAIENYERAANLRDQIKDLMNQSHKE